jgi:hypothetical protein
VSRLFQAVHVTTDFGVDPSISCGNIVEVVLGDNLVRDDDVPAANTQMRPSSIFSNARHRRLKKPEYWPKPNLAPSQRNLDPPPGRSYIRRFATG